MDATIGHIQYTETTCILEEGMLHILNIVQENPSEPLNQPEDVLKVGLLTASYRTLTDKRQKERPKVL